MLNACNDGVDLPASSTFAAPALLPLAATTPTPTLLPPPLLSPTAALLLTTTTLLPLLLSPSTAPATLAACSAPTILSPGAVFMWLPRPRLASWGEPEGEVVDDAEVQASGTDGKPLVGAAVAVGDSSPAAASLLIVMMLPASADVAP
jgi:hypothetical protein